MGELLRRNVVRAKNCLCHIKPLTASAYKGGAVTFDAASVDDDTKNSQDHPKDKCGDSYHNYSNTRLDTRISPIALPIPF